ncbi:hypothetical protein [Treponema sp.]|uniref:hypothetical protein n=1 Tax=Treponema sp. TaxID=166 RepID=UPI0025E4BF19|nr:hypothetical protein [Treponema sp.]MCR5219214.1 hypothetical protein [Treponema sp.]
MAENPLFVAFYDSEEGLHYKVEEQNNEKFLQSLNPEGRGTKTDLKGFFNRKLEIVGKEKNGSTIFYIGCEEDLFGKVYYYKDVYILSEDRIYIVYGHTHGRDHNYINGEWH